MPHPSNNRAITTASKEVDARIAAIVGWRGETLANIRALIHEALPDVIEGAGAAG